VLQVNWAFTDKQEFIDIVEVVYRGARKGRGLVVSPKGAASSPFKHALQHQYWCHMHATLDAASADYSTKYRY